MREESGPAGDGDPNNEELVELHAALVLGTDPTVPPKLAELLLPSLRRRFHRFAALDSDTVDSTIGWSIARYLRDPSRFDPERGALLPYMWQDIQGDLLNEVERRMVASSDHAPWRRRREIPDTEALEVERDRRNPPVDEEVLDAIDPFDMPAALVDQARAELGRFDRRDHALLGLLTAGVRETAPYAEVLAISHLDIATQRQEVKRHKDRLKARLEVIRARLGTPR